MLIPWRSDEQANAILIAPNFIIVRVNQPKRSSINKYSASIWFAEFDNERRMLKGAGTVGPGVDYSVEIFTTSLAPPHLTASYSSGKKRNRDNAPGKSASVDGFSLSAEEVNGSRLQKRGHSLQGKTRDRAQLPRTPSNWKTDSSILASSILGSCSGITRPCFEEPMLGRTQLGILG
ncbi:unnamed protein product [Schistocephalus solidus]|uniref:RRM domain-containing protein n=1 Tax=Schistocephalus solidus TaxID=70667 RepID=A0A183SM31_SCHSO|nr:unnamed protein product [Schistocephalus solidus]